MAGLEFPSDYSSFWWCTLRTKTTSTTTTGLLKRTQKFIAGNSKFDMNFIYLHVNRICVTPKTFEREIYEQQSQELPTVKRSDMECIVDRDLDRSHVAGRKVEGADSLPPMMPERARKATARVVVVVV